MTDTMQQLDRQNAEFKAADEFAKQVRRLALTTVVDDDYPEVRHDYESALAGLIRAMRNNGRFQTGNRYQLKEI